MSLNVRQLLGLKPPKRLIVTPVSMPLSVRFTPETSNWRLKAGQLVHVDSPDEGPISVALGELDAWRVRGEFLQARSIEEMLTFLQSTGTFCWTTESWTFNELLRFQKVVKRLMATKPLKWRTGIFRDQKVLEACVAHRHFQADFWWANPPKTAVPRMQIREYHYVVLTARTTLGALLATIHVDHLRGAEWLPCARCGRQFQVTGHRKKYCPGPCAHAEASKAYRLKQKKAK